MTLSKELLEYFKSFSQHGSGDNLVQIEPQEICLLVCIAHRDLTKKDLLVANKAILKLAKKSYYEISSDEIEAIPKLTAADCISYLRAADGLKVNEFTMYFGKLCELHRKRFKYRTILKNQPFPTAEQIGPRSLLEYGNCTSALLFNWMTWRKWAYDIDNRSAQETGYFFEPVLVSCIGGETISHSKSPVKRIDDNGKTTNDGRQIDCYIKHGEKQYAYELKMRVTIAASGQGRFNEEMTFPQEARAAGLIPVLVVFDSTESTLLTKLTAAYSANGGKVYIGEAAWAHLKKEAGPSMGLFIEKYIEPPIRHMEKESVSIPSKITLAATKKKIIISESRSSKYVIKRS